MAELRHDPIHDRWVVVAAERAARPHTFRAMEAIPHDRPANCPFCPGNEGATPPEVFRTGSGEPNEPGWKVRVFPNKFPIVSPAPDPDGAEAPPAGTDAWRRARPATGTHEVAVMSPEHHRSLADLDDNETAELFGVLAGRVQAHRELGHAYTQVLINHGKAAGASIEHPHVQMIAIDFAPAPVVDLTERGAQLGEPIVRASRDREANDTLALPSRPGSVAWCPWASAGPFTAIVTPEFDSASFAEAPASQIAPVARTTGDILRALRAAEDEQPYNVLVVSRANTDDRPFQWYVEIQPRMSVIAGFELGAGVYVNIVPPEQAAEMLRDQMVGSPSDVSR